MSKRLNNLTDVPEGNTVCLCEQSPLKLAPKQVREIDEQILECRLRRKWIYPALPTAERDGFAWLSYSNGLSRRFTLRELIHEISRSLNLETELLAQLGQANFPGVAACTS